MAGFLKRLWVASGEHTANGWMREYVNTRSIHALQEAIKTWTGLVESDALNAEQRATFSAMLANCWWTYYESTHDPTMLEQTITARRNSIRWQVSGSLEWLRELNDLSMALCNRYIQISGAIKDLNESVAVAEQALERTPLDSTARPPLLGNLSHALFHRYERESVEVDAQRSADLAKEAITLLPDVNVMLLKLYLNLGTLYASRFNRTNDLIYLDEALEWLNRVMMAAIARSDIHTRAQTNLGATLLARFMRLGNEQDLTQAHEHCLQALQACFPHNPLRAICATNLTATLLARSMRTGFLADFRESIDMLEAEIELTQPRSPIRAVLLANLALCFDEIQHISGDPAAHEAAITRYREALNLSDTDTPNWLTHQNLAASLYLRYKRERKDTDLEEAFAIWRAIIQHTSSGSNTHLYALASLGGALTEQAQTLKDPIIIEEAISLCEQAYAQGTPDHPNYVQVLNNLGFALMTASDVAPSIPIAPERVTTIYREVCQSGLKHAPREVMRSARKWGQWALKRSAWHESLEAYTYGLQARDRLYQAQLLQRDRRAWLVLASTIHTEAAFVAARTGDFRQAVLFMEMGRSRELGEAIARDRADFAQLRDLNRPIVERYEQALGRVRVLQSHPAGILHSSQLQAALNELERATTAMQQEPAFAQFFRPVRWDDITAVILPGMPMVYLLATSVGGLALILDRQDELADVTVIPCWLEGLTEARLHKLFFGAPEQETEPSWAQAYAVQSEHPAQWQATIDRVTRELWDIALGPLLEHMRPSAAPQMILIPSGLLALLPIHLAWTDKHHQRHYALDDCCITIVPSARIVAETRRNNAPFDTLHTLIIQEPQPVPLSRLKATPAEVAGVIACVGTPTLLVQTEATREAALANLEHAQVAHFACHGFANLVAPDQSGLLFAHSQWLTVADLLSLSRSRSRLAVLSACETGLVGINLPDEAISLPSSFLYAGFAGAVGSLWPVNDVATAMLMERFYRLWYQDGLPPAEALRQAQIWLRDTTVAEKRAYYNSLATAQPSTNGDSSRQSVAAQEFLKMLILYKNEYRHDHPYYWGAFQYFGT